LTKNNCTGVRNLNNQSKMLGEEKTGDARVLGAEMAPCNRVFGTFRILVLFSIFTIDFYVIFL